MTAPVRSWSPVAAFVGALVVYVALGLVVKSTVLNWIVGPLFPVLVLYVIPHAIRRLGSRR